MKSAKQVQKSIRALKDSKKALSIQRYFKTGPGEYSSGDVFLGLSMPQCRAIAKQAQELPLAETYKLLESKYHEERMIALCMLAYHYKSSPNLKQQTIISNYLKRIRGSVNNWDLVDVSAPILLGNFIWKQNNKVSLLLKLARSNNLWEKRVAIVSTLFLIKRQKFDPTLEVSEILMNDRHDLIHKAVGWMLREVGKQSKITLNKFLKAHAHHMPRTMLRYALEKHNVAERKKFMKYKNAYVS